MIVSHTKKQEGLGAFGKIVGIRPSTFSLMCQHVVKSFS